MSNMETKLRAVLDAQRTLSHATQDLIDSWSEDPDTRNRPDRQKCCTKLVECLPKARNLGDAIYACAEAMGIDL